MRVKRALQDDVNNIHDNDDGLLRSLCRVSTIAKYCVNDNENVPHAHLTQSSIFIRHKFYNLLSQNNDLIHWIPTLPIIFAVHSLFGMSFCYLNQLNQKLYRYFQLYLL